MFAAVTTDFLLRTLSAFHAPRGERGQTLAEYSLIITAIAVGLVLLAMLVFREALGGAFAAATDCLADRTC